MVKTVLTTLLVLMMFSFGYAEKMGTIKGRAAYRGEVFQGTEILVYHDAVDIDLTKPDYVFGPTKIDGTYEFVVPEGKYYLVALKKHKERKDYIPQIGDFYCFYSGAPVEVVAGGISYVGFNLIKVKSTGKDRITKSESGIYGKVLFEEKPLQKCYIYIYKDFKGGFRGPAFITYPSVDGSFKISLPPGKYYVMARKRQKGGMYGPVEEGDYFNFFYGNPLVVKKGTYKYVEIETVKRLSQLEEGTGFAQVKGIVVDSAKNKPVSGLFVLFYQNKNMQGKPLYISGRTSSTGEFSIKLPKGVYYVTARESIGGPPVSNEWYGKLAEEVVVKDESDQKNLKIMVEKIK